MKIQVTIEGEDLNEIIKELHGLLDKNREEIRKILHILAEEAINVVEETKVIDKGAEIYIKLNRAINWKYKQQK
ncbi:MAG: hypothetical protein J7K61_00215 [Thermoplasmata archaeon]|nr:hypothetical protein [Thermoplasmata archaeon]